MAKVDVNVVTSLVGKGLEREYLLLKDFLNQRDVYVNAYHYTNYAGSNFVRADVNMFLEVLMPNVLNLAKENWLFPNSEWWNCSNDRFLPQFSKICCKTHDCVRIWKQRLASDRPERVVYTGFEARDLYDESVPREEKILHVAGESEFKNTEAVIMTWARPQWPVQPWPGLTVVSRQKRFRDLCVGLEGVVCHERVTDDELRVLMNSHRYHLIPSAYEGFGHILHEGLGVGAVLITTDAPPMSESPGVAFKIPVSGRSERSLAQLCSVCPGGIAGAVYRAVMASPGLKQQLGQSARANFLSERQQFRDIIIKMLEGVTGARLGA